MKVTNPELLERVSRFLTSITAKEKVCVLHDADPDGICTAVIIAKCIYRLRKKKIDVRMTLMQKKLTEAMAAQIKQDGITHLIIADFSADQYPDQLLELVRTCKILVIDHHKAYANFKSENIVIYKPKLFCDIATSNYSAAKLAYDAASRITDISDLDWLAAVGLIADIATAPWKDWLEKVFKKYSIQMKQDLFETELGKAASTINSAEVYDKKLVPACYELFYKAKGPQDIIKSKLMKYREIIQAELNRHIAAFETQAAEYGDVRIYQMHSKYEIQGPLSTLVCLKYPNNTIILINVNTYARVSARRYDQKIIIGDVIQQLARGFNASAGGHARSAGARFDKKYLNEFKKRVIKWSTSNLR